MASQIPLRAALAGALSLAFCLPALAQQPAPPASPPAWAQGRSADQANSPLAPHAPRLTATPAAQIPVSSIRLPEGFKAELWASGMPGARMMARGEDGTIYVGTRTIGRVYAVKDENGTRTPRVLAQRLDQPNGVAVRNGSLYVIAINKVLRFDNIAQNPNVEPVDMTAAFNLPTEAHHGWKFAAFGPDGKLYMNIGVPCNVCTFDENKHALIVRFNPDGSGREVVGQGVRNSVGFDWRPGTNVLYASNNARDWAGNDTPEDTLHRLARMGEHHGFPYCSGNAWQDPGHTGRKCSEFPAPVALLGPHTAPLGMRFYTGTMFPEAYRGRAFIARHGSWNRDTKSGFDVVTVTLNEDGTQGKVEPFLTGLLNTADNSFSGRPTDVLVMPDGALLVSDEQTGAIYRISYQR
ncbi:PQQ-dependent sugar dehydrogenase [Roseomonas xinghualingensis]|uniref:PQQ-dependent sugar dehydrogenase n=1 Tax=Roseomonas xinghualingensis TaxID=2986475 RepID=UPI0021F0F179|nr:PQQ-dependent sugar dehydrogenase [Roseomonas sp. SXEYE001]MCV4209324.1 PQQ-dependent sugar dehydrogenase [Roseomonas sp. SXEYE001]